MGDRPQQSLSHFEYLMIPFSLTSLPGVGTINDVLQDVLHPSLFVYLDDIYIFPRASRNMWHTSVWSSSVSSITACLCWKCQFHTELSTFFF